MAEIAVALWGRHLKHSPVNPRWIDRDHTRATSDRPTLIVCKTVIGKGSPNRAGTGKAHGEPLGADEVKLTRSARLAARTLRRARGGFTAQNVVATVASVLSSTEKSS